MTLILETWELATSFVSLGSRMTNFRKYLQDDLENDKEFYKGDISTFVVKGSNVSEFQRKEDDLPFVVRIKELKYVG
jgi:hypothetical protein